MVFIKKNLAVFVLAAVLLFGGCKKPKSISYPIVPQVSDGVTRLKMNNPAESRSLRGPWSEPHLGSNKKFHRILSAPGGSILFDVPRREKYFAQLKLRGSAAGLSVRLGERSFTINKNDPLLIFDEKYLEQGPNTLEFILDQGQKIAIEEIHILPKRAALLKDKPQKGRIFLPCSVTYYLNPRVHSHISLQFDPGKLEKVPGLLTVQTEKDRKETRLTVSNAPLELFPRDDTIHRFTLSFPQAKGNYMVLTESLVYTADRGNSGPLPQKISAQTGGKNLVFILLDAARADHMGVYGYERKTTPHIDRLAQTSYVFTDCISESAYTLASTGTLLTGLPADFHGVTSTFHTRLSQEVVTLPELFREQGYFTGAISSNPYFGRAYDYHQGFDRFVELFEGQKLVDAGDFLAPFDNMLQRCKDKPFFIYLHIREPHTEFVMPPPYLGTFQEKYKNQSADLQKEVRAIYHGSKRQPGDLALLTALYDENLLYADSVVGQLIETMKRHGVYDNTVKVILGDHGEGLGEHGHVGHNVVLNREGIHIPMIVEIPGSLKEPRFIDKPAATSDLTVTVARLFDLTYPYPDLTMGKNLFTLPPARQRICRSMSAAGRRTWYMVESTPYRMLFTPSQDKIAATLYNLSVDPLEQHPIKDNDHMENLLFFNLEQFLKHPGRSLIQNKGAQIRAKDLESLKSLGYIK